MKSILFAAAFVGLIVPANLIVRARKSYITKAQQVSQR
jgi:hypothetical protein